nr:immunoglobulin heavy chain junction region [Macaca mulatta]
CARDVYGNGFDFW